MSEKDRVQILLGEGITFAEMMLKEHGEFHPYGWAMNPEGEAISVAMDMGQEFPTGKDVIEELFNNFRSKGKEGEYIATAVFYDVRVILPNSDVKSDAIAIALDDVNGLSLVAFKPYKIENSSLIFENIFAHKGENKVFSKPS